MTVAAYFYLLNREDRNDSKALYMDGPHGHLLTDHPPAIGDLINLRGSTVDPDDDENMLKFSGSFRVLDRRWSPASYGSQVWPYGERQTGPEWLDIMVEPAAEFFAHGPTTSEQASAPDLS
jgi:hypothetical protein